MSKYKEKEDKRQCLMCGTDISHRRINSIYCSDGCGGKHRNSLREHRCEECDGIFTGRKKKYCSDDCHREVRNRRRRETKNVKEKTTLKCEWCNEEYQVLKRYAYQSQYCSDECGQERYSREVRGHRPVEQDRARRKMQKKQRKEKLKREQHQRYLERLTVKECEWCGSSYETDILNQKTCSKECRRKRRNQLSSLRKDERIPDSQIVDRDISLERLHKRDNGICYLCNKECDYSDLKTTKDGYEYVGPTYPSVDHVMPVVHGGLHAWDNVRLACHSCNSIKSDTIPDNLKELLPDDAYSVARKISPRMKTTLQLDLGGNLIATYESTAQAERETGFKRKGIQNNARGETKTYKGYKWEYV